MNKIHKGIRKGFTLLEILLVIAAIGILAAIVLVAINPNRQISQVRNAERRSEVNTLYKALEQYLIDNRDYPAGIDGTPRDICGNTSGCVDLSVLVPTYIAAIPVDPQGGAYKVSRNSDNNRIAVRAPSAELGQTIAINSPPPPKFIASSCTYANKKISIPYIEGEVGYNYASQTINSTGITGLTATLTSGTLSASGNLEYAVTGTPSGAGTANFNLGNIGNTGVACNNSNIAVNVTALTLATGGDTVTDITVGTDTYRVHRFTTVGSSTLTVVNGGEFEYLVIAGGGGGGANRSPYSWYGPGAGGGSGGFLTGTLSLSAVSQTVIVGNGGAAGLPYIQNGISGDNSVFASITATGGGGGGSGSYSNGLSGGSGGGGGLSGGLGGSASPSGQGNAGFKGEGNSAGGGGGANAPGNFSVGGAGKTSSITGTSVTYAGGGGGASSYQGSGSLAGNGGAGGGGSGAYGTSDGENGVANTGGGGGGGGLNSFSNPFKGGNGGSGIIIVRYKLVLTY